MAGHSYEEGIKQVKRGFFLLGVVTIAEVFVALLGNGHLIRGFELSRVIMYPVMIGLSLYKAYFIVNEFMHMKYEVKGLAMSVILPTFLLVWAVIAFMSEGNYWNFRRTQIQDKNAIEVSVDKTTGQLMKTEELPSEVSFK